MSKNWRTILLFATSGLAIAALFFGYFDMDPTPGSSVAICAGSAAQVLCFGTLLFVTIDFDIQPHTKAFNEVWLIIALANCAVYAIVGAAYVGLRKKPKGPATS